jgi:hypothetical protein
VLQAVLLLLLLLLMDFQRLPWPVWKQQLLHVPCMDT